MKDNNFVLKIGGSLLYDSDMNLNLKVMTRLMSWYKKAKKKYTKIVIVVGGGKLSRNVNDKVRQYLKEEIYQHGVAMQITQVNALVVSGFLNDKEIVSPEKLGEAYEYLMDNETQVVVCGGLKTGWSTDMDAAVFADVLGCKRVYKLSDIEGLYSEDPKKNPNAIYIKTISWDEYAKMFGITDDSGGKPNAHMPVGVESVKFCMNKGVSFHLSGGNMFDKDVELEEILGEGTFIHV
jgi:uridylate kinase